MPSRSLFSILSVQLGLRLRSRSGEGGRQRKAPSLQPSSDLEGTKIWEITLSDKDIPKKKKKKSSPKALPDRKLSLFDRKKTHLGGRFVVSCPEDYLLML